jgi:transcriptional repressor NrdR
MRCPRCAHAESRVVDSRQGREATVIRRRRECESCGFRFTTLERLEYVLPSIVKRDGRRESFVREKVVAALRAACQKRPVSYDVLASVADLVEQKLAASGEREVESRRIGEILMAELRTIDEVAWLRFASVYHSFGSINEFLVAAARVREEPS